MIGILTQEDMKGVVDFVNELSDKFNDLAKRVEQLEGEVEESVAPKQQAQPKASGKKPKLKL